MSINAQGDVTARWCTCRVGYIPSVSFANAALDVTSDARGSCMRALVRAMLWKDTCAKHAYVAFLRDKRTDEDEDEVTT